MEEVTANTGQKVLKLSKKEWSEMGKNKGWITAQEQNGNVQSNVSMQIQNFFKSFNNSEKIAELTKALNNNDLDAAGKIYLQLAQEAKKQIESLPQVGYQKEAANFNLNAFMAAMIAAGNLLASTPNMSPEIKAQVASVTQELSNKSSQPENKTQFIKDEKGRDCQTVSLPSGTQLKIPIMKNKIIFTPALDRNGQPTKDKDGNEKFNEAVNVNGKVLPVIRDLGIKGVLINDELWSIIE